MPICPCRAALMEFDWLDVPFDLEEITPREIEESLYTHPAVEEAIIREMNICSRHFYSIPRILQRVWDNIWRRRDVLISLVGNFSYRSNLRVSSKAYSDFKRHCDNAAGHPS